MAALAAIYKVFTATGMASMAIYHLVSTTQNHLKSRDYSPKPFYPLNTKSPNSSYRNLHLYLLIVCLSVSFLHQIITSSDSDFLLHGRTPVHRFLSLQNAAVLFLFLLLSVSLLLSETTSLLPLPPDLLFAAASAVFFLQYYVSSSAADLQISDLQSHCDSVAARISALSSFLCLLLVCFPKLFAADLALGASILLQGIWAFQTGLTLYVDAFVPEGCHKLLDVVSGVEGSTRCDLDDSKFRALAILDLLFLVHVFVVIVIVFIIYAVLVKSTGAIRSSKLGAYEALPTVLASSPGDSNHVQMKALTGTQDKKKVAAVKGSGVLELEGTTGKWKISCLSCSKDNLFGP